LNEGNELLLKCFSLEALHNEVQEVHVSFLFSLSETKTFYNF